MSKFDPNELNRKLTVSVPSDASDEEVDKMVDKAVDEHVDKSVDKMLGDLGF